MARTKKGGAPAAEQIGLFNPQHEFGGDWTEQKLEILERYLKAYRTALKAQPFYLMYIDAFAGTGYRSVTNAGAPLDPAQLSLMQPEGQGEAHASVIDSPEQRFLEGSAVRALRLEPGFDSYHFIEKDRTRALQLGNLEQEFPERNIYIHNGDANQALQQLIRDVPWHKKMKRNQQLIRDVPWHKKMKRNGLIPRAVLFLDPYGVNVSWKTLEMIAESEAIDLWYLFPSGIGVNRLLQKDGKMPESWRTRLDDCFGTGDWYQRFYQVEERATLFGSEQTIKKKADFDDIDQFLIERLMTIFCVVAPVPRKMKNSKGYPMYSFCFAASNPKGGPIALGIANHILTRI